MAKQLEDYMQWPEIEALMYAECGRPETVLRPKQVTKAMCLSRHLNRRQIRLSFPVRI